MIAVERERRRRGRVAPLWSPYSGKPQEAACESRADVLGYGGQAGGGKTDAILGIGLTAHRKGIIFRREYPQLRDVIERSREIVKDRGKFNQVQNLWRLDDGRTLEFGAAQHEHDVQKYRGRPHDYIAVDEATEFHESQVRFLLGWLRSTVANQRCRVVLTFNPPTTVTGRWVIAFFAPWLDERHPNPALPGELRWYAMINGTEVERPDSAPFDHEGETIRPLSRTFIPAALQDNPVLAATDYGATLQALPEPLRSQLLRGDFSAGLKDDAWQVIPTAWVRAAQARWRPDGGGDAPLTALGMDVAHGGRDKTVFAPRRRNWIDALTVYRGQDTPDGASAAAYAMLVVANRKTRVNVDSIGYGAAAYEKLLEHGVDAHPINFALGSEYTDLSGKFVMRNLRAEAYWRVRDALDPEQGHDLALPPDPELLADLTEPTYAITPSGVQIEPKDAVAKRLRRSPDKGDAVALAMLEPAGFGAPTGAGVSPAKAVRQFGRAAAPSRDDEDRDRERRRRRFGQR